MNKQYTKYAIRGSYIAEVYATHFVTEFDVVD